MSLTTPLLPGPPSWFWNLQSGPLKYLILKLYIISRCLRSHFLIGVNLMENYKWALSLCCASWSHSWTCIFGVQFNTKFPSFSKIPFAILHVTWLPQLQDRCQRCLPIFPLLSLQQVPPGLHPTTNIKGSVEIDNKNIYKKCKSTMTAIIELHFLNPGF